MSENKEEKIKNESIINETEEITPSDFRFDLNAPDDEGDRIITKKNKLKLALYALCFIIIAAIISYVVCNYTLKSPKDKVIKAYSNTLSEMLSAEKIFDGKALKSFITTYPSEAELSVIYKSSDSLDGSLPISLSGSGLKAEALCDPVAGQAGGSLNLTVGSMPIEAAEFYADKTAFCGRAPLLEKEWVKVPLENIFSAYNSSALSSYLGSFEYSDDFSLDIFELPSLINIPSTSEVMKEYLNSDREVFATLKEGMSAAKSSDTLSLDNGKEARGYNVVFAGKDLKDLLYDFAAFGEEKTDYTPFMGEFLPLIKVIAANDALTAEGIGKELNRQSYEVFRSFADSLNDSSYALTVYVYKRKMVGAKWQLPVENYDGEEETYTFTLAYPDGNSVTDKLTLEITNSEGFKLNLETTDYDGAKALDVSSAFTYWGAPYTAEIGAEYNKDTAEYSLSANISNSENSFDSLSVSAEGRLLQTDSSFELSADNLKIESGGKNLLTTDFDFGITELQSEIEKPDGNITDLFTADSEKLTALINEIKSNYQSLLGMAALAGIGG